MSNITVTYNHNNKVFTCNCGKENKNIPKSAGFKFHNPNRCWYMENYGKCFYCDRSAGFGWVTTKCHNALKLKKYMDNLALEACDKYEESLKESKAAEVLPSDKNVYIPSPKGIDFYPFQKAGIIYAANPSRSKVIIGDEMGLGKTPQAIGVANLIHAQKVLVVCPASIRENWRREFERFSTIKHKYYIHRKEIDLPEDVTCIITNYERLRYNKRNMDIWQQYVDRDWDLVIVDEAHYLKNPKAMRTKGLIGFWDKNKRKRIEGIANKAKKVLFLTGTPIVNRTIELHTLLAFINPRKWGSWVDFVKKYTKASQTYIRTRTGVRKIWKNLDTSDNEEELQADMRALCLVRRLKKQVLTELPPKRRQIVYLDPSDISGLKNKISRLQKLTPLEGLDFFKDLRTQIKGKSGAFEELSKIRYEIGLKKVSSVLEYVDNALAEMVEPKIIVFVHHLDVAQQLKNGFERLDSKNPLPGRTITITGDVSIDKRQELVDKFNDDPSVEIAILSIKAAGVGLNLQKNCSTLVFAEFSWTPGDITQAEDRIHRIGQIQDVLIQYLVYDGTLDAYMAETLAGKQIQAYKVLDRPEEKHEIPKEKKSESKIKIHYTPMQIKAMGEAVIELVSVCDRAISKDDCGFNRMDTDFGHSIASQINTQGVESLSEKQCDVLFKILGKYHRQLPERIYRILYPKKATEMWGEPDLKRIFLDRVENELPKCYSWVIENISQFQSIW